LATARVFALATTGSMNDTARWNNVPPTRTLPRDSPYPFPDPASPATLPAVLEGADGKRIVVDYWGDGEDRTGRDNVKFWGGAGGYPGAGLANDALEIVRERCVDASSDPFALTGEQSSSFRLDWRRDYIPIDAGFSLNSHSGRIATVGFPLVEIFAAIGLGNARPAKLGALEYRYGVISGNGELGVSSAFHPSLVRAALGVGLLPFRMRRFRMHLGWPAKEGQARAITTVIEETNP
jgi:CRISPR-associated protein Csx14